MKHSYLCFVLSLVLFFSAHQIAAQTCNITVPNDPLTVTGLSSPFFTTCDQNVMATFANGMVLNTDTGALFVYNPLIINAGTTPAITIVRPTLPTNYIAAIWFGSNACDIFLVPANPSAAPNSVEQGFCVNGGGYPYSIFNQVAHCNAPAFFTAANQLIAKQMITVPQLGKAKDGTPCPTTRSFAVVDMDQSDNVPTIYLSTSNGRLAQDTPLNRINAKPVTLIENGSDNLLLDSFILPALNCTPWRVTDLAAQTQGSTQLLPALALNELLAANAQAFPVARIPALDDMVVNPLTPAQPILAKINAYRVGVNQYPVTTANTANTTRYCIHLLSTGAPIIWNQRNLTTNAASPVAGMGLFLFLVTRFTASVGPGGLNCQVGQNPFTINAQTNVITFSTTANATNAALGKNLAQTGFDDVAINDAYFMNMLFPQVGTNADAVPVIDGGDDGMMSTSSGIGIVVGVVVAGVLVIAVVSVFGYRRYKARKINRFLAAASAGDHEMFLHTEGGSGTLEKASLPSHGALPIYNVSVDSMAHEADPPKPRPSLVQGVPTGWASYTDENGRMYWFNHSNGTSSWVKPADVA